LESKPSSGLISVIITVRDEEPNLARLLESLIPQEPPFEVLLVDAQSRDRTFAIARAFAERYPDIIFAWQSPGSRGQGRNAAAARARGEGLAFIDGDCIADSAWLSRIRQGLARSAVVGGRTVPMGSSAFGELDRVELYQAGNDVSFPSCNLGYRTELFRRLDGFDPRFITAEDIDLNLRAVRAGAQILYDPAAIVFHRVRPTVLRFLYQAFWNGYGRKQLTEKHGTLWGHYRIRRLLRHQHSVLAIFRMAAALTGYLTRVATGGDRRLDRAVRSR